MNKETIDDSPWSGAWILYTPLTVWFLERFGNCEMEWTEESVIELIELYKRKEIIWDPKWAR
jgi:hypothetical protein